REKFPQNNTHAPLLIRRSPQNHIITRRAWAQLDDLEHLAVVDDARPNPEPDGAVAHARTPHPTTSAALSGRVRSTVKWCVHTRWKTADRTSGAGNPQRPRQASPTDWPAISPARSSS